MAMETGFLQYAMELLKKDYARELKVLGVELPDVSQIPAVKFADIKEIVAEKYNHKMRNPFDLEPEEEVLIGRYAKEEWGSDFVFVTHYPSKKRPFYAMDDPEDPRYTLSFDLLFRGLEITTGGQRIHARCGALTAARAAVPARRTVLCKTARGPARRGRAGTRHDDDLPAHAVVLRAVLRDEQRAAGIHA